MEGRGGGDVSGCRRIERPAQCSGAKFQHWLDLAPCRLWEGRGPILQRNVRPATEMRRFNARSGFAGSPPNGGAPKMTCHKETLRASCMLQLHRQSMRIRRACPWANQSVRAQQMQRPF